MKETEPVYHSKDYSSKGKSSKSNKQPMQESIIVQSKGSDLRRSNVSDEENIPDNAFSKSTNKSRAIAKGEKGRPRNDSEEGPIRGDFTKKESREEIEEMEAKFNKKAKKQDDDKENATKLTKPKNRKTKTTKREKNNKQTNKNQKKETT